MLKPREIGSCPHDRRPGTSVCLYCLQDARSAARRRRNRVLARTGLATMGVVAVVALGIGGYASLAPNAGSRSRSVDEAVTRTVERSSAPSVTPQASERPATPAIPEGRRELGDGMVAERIGDTVTVHFDTELLRTRYDWKFEGIVRGTLPLMFGDLARMALDSIPHGELLDGANLLGTLPVAGLAIPVAGEAGSVRVWPIVRPGRDGPLVVGYRAVRESV